MLVSFEFPPIEASSGRKLSFHFVLQRKNSEQKGRNKKGATAAAAAHIQAEMHNLSERIEALAASARQRDKAQVSKENMAALRRSMETNKMQVRRAKLFFFYMTTLGRVRRQHHLLGVRMFS